MATATIVRQERCVAVRPDVAIVGAGPAGAWAAYNLARRGARVMVIDGSHPREKPCGGGVTGRALTLVSRRLPETSFDACVIRTARFVQSTADKCAAVSLARSEGAVPDLVVVSRDDFDRALLAAARNAGAAFLSARVCDVTIDCEGVRVETTAGAI